MNKFIKTSIPLIIAPHLFIGCASVTIKGPARIVQGKDGVTRLENPTIYKASGIDRLPMQDVLITHNSVNIKEHMPANGSWPTKRVTTMDKNGNVITNEEPMYASNASNVTNTMHNVWAGVAKNAIGWFMSAWTTMGLSKAASDAAIATTNANKATSIATTNANAQTAQAKIAAEAAEKAMAVPVVAP